mmetsp:Transcript_101714/g.180646  ORF Transcript_101714/g.180646 Transcript_101714/m.180646 type:complete len:293 (+) Transcript_101714:33-911(+)
MSALRLATESTLLLLGIAATAYNESSARDYVWVNQAMSVEDTALLKTWTCGLPCDQASAVGNVQLLRHESTGNFGIAAHRAEACLLVFRGSKNAMNWLQDAGFFKKAPYDSCPDCQVHTGFYEAWEVLRGQAEERLRDLDCQGRQLHITGHSLGAAMASLAAWELLEKGFDVAEVYTFGEPRVGNAAWVSQFQEKMKGRSFYRVVHYKDPAPHYPFLNFGFRHAGPEVYYSTWTSGPYTICIDGEDTSCSGQWNVFQCIFDGCLHCSYLGLNPCEPGAMKPSCNSRRLAEPK